MRRMQSHMSVLVLGSLSVVLSACSYNGASQNNMAMQNPPKTNLEPKATPNYASRIPQHINTHEKIVVIDPRVHVWGAYDANGDLVRAGLATAGANWCPDIGRPCRTRVGTFRVNSLGAPGCKSTIYPKPKGGAPMPYCMFFNGNQGMHGSMRGAVVEGNVSHGCVRMQVEDAQWLRYNFVHVGTKVMVKPYS